MVVRSDGPFKYFQDLHGGVNGDTIRADAQNPGLDATTIGALSGELEGDATKVGSQLSGEITADVQKNPQELSASARELAGKGMYAVGLINGFAKMVDTFDTSTNTCNVSYHTHLRQMQQSYDRSSIGVGDTTKPPFDQKGAEASSKALFQGDYNKALTTLDTDADSIATKFKAPPSDYLNNVKELIRQGLIPLSAAAFYPGMKLSAADKQQYYKSVLGPMSADEQKQWIEQHKNDLDPAAASAIAPAVQEEYAQQIAEDIKKPGTIDQADANLLVFFAGQQAFAHSLYTQVSPRDMAAEVEDFNNDVFDDPRAGIDQNKLKTYRDFVNGAGLALATYSTAKGPYAPPGGGKALADQWYNAITADDHKQDASALTLLVRAGGHQAEFDHTFLGNLTGRVYEWERDQDGAVWGPRDDDGMWDPNHPPHVSSTYSGDQGGGATTYSWAGGTPATDGLANLLGGMEHSPAAAQDFFMGRYDGAHGSMQDRMDYLVGGGDGRTWDASDNSDEGDGLGKALTAACVGQDTRTADGTAIASALFHNVAEYGGKGDGTFTHEWHPNPGIVDSLGNIAAGYTGDLYDELSGSGAQHGALHLDLGDDPSGTLKAVLGEIGRPDDKSALETVTSAMMLECRAQVADQVSGLHGPHTLDNLLGAGLDGQQQRNGKVMGVLLSEGLSLASDEDKSAENRAAILSKSIDIASGFIPGAGTLLGEGAHELTKMTVDTLKGEAIEAMKNGVAAHPDTDSYLNSRVMPLDQKIQYTAIDALTQHGYLGPQDTKFGHWGGIPQEVLVGEPPNQHIDPRLYDQDGHQIDASKMSPEEQARITVEQNAWTRYNETPQSDQVNGLTQQAEFMKYFEDPTLQYTK